MPKIERRHITVPLYSGTVVSRLAELTEQVEKAEREEKSTRRLGTTSNALELAQEHDRLRAEADENAVQVTLWAIVRRDWARLADDHPPREGERQDGLYGVNMKTFPDALVPLSLLQPGEGEDYDSRVKLAAERVEEFDDLSQVQRMKLVHASWEVNVGDDALPKSSLVSQLQERRERASKPQPASG